MPAMRVRLLSIALGAISLAASAASEPLVLASPSGVVVVSVDVVDGRPTYAVRFGAQEVVRPSSLGLALEGAPRLESAFGIANHSRVAVREVWRPVYGERSEYPDRYNALTVEFREGIPPGRVLVIEFRAYDEGAAFRYTLPTQPALGDFVIGAERTEFRLPAGAHAWDAPRAQASYTRVPISQLTAPTERPLLVEVPGGPWVAIAEAGVEHAASMFLRRHDDDPQGVVSHLKGPVTGRTPFASPWRVILMGNRPGDLLEHNYLLLNLSPASRLDATDWIRPGKILREVTLSTKGAREAVDFASGHGLQYIEFDAGWYGHEYEETSDATRVSVDPRRLRPEPEYRGLDLPAVIEYAKSKGIGVWLYVNRRALERQIDTLLPLFASWCVVGVKYGFVEVHSQPWTEWLYRAIAMAATHRLMLDIHDEFRPTGMSRTYPHLLTQEGIRGNEEFPDATQGTTLPFTRMLAGAGDHTFCWLDQRLKNTWGYQAAHAVVIYSPLQFLYWYDRASALTDSGTASAVGMEWFARLPTVWDDTKVLAGRPGEPVVVARRKGTQWFVGAISNDSPQQVRVPLEFLDAGRDYLAESYVDGDGPRALRKEQRTVRRGDAIDLALQARGGAAIALSPRP